ncbi:succinate-semialdehyde dehydrogenase/glutarate-semialdehyde dehydrogenase [Scopulibacillus daqui]|uniref:Aldehyde dehydrogenase n=1 Tax=Scopulibacillus daqui TaxID=1469162 RepID=A0ABS2Q2W8_9BACL|nr:NAD-dependent succinate-semialdehyde dehydrogenase [Scopulibacillus daqui]MBM7646270.1 succinate-semialdehyde dehydrogenase/glutarate-semialdehyde dehydrogenase [Scopulibacillus daqui]
MKSYQMFVNGQWIGNHLEQFNVINPANKEIIAQVPKGGAEEAREAVDAAYKAFKAWSEKTAEERSHYLLKWHELINKHKEEIAELMTIEQGKPYNEALGEVKYANSFISWYAEEGKRIYGETIPASDSRKRLLVQKQPVGVAAAITPWNFPAAMITRKAGPALAAGCTVIVKPAEETPLTALKLAELAEKAGIPNGVINVVTGTPQDISEVWLKDDRVRKLTFTGSTEVGKLLMRGAADTVKKISLELGGHAPFIVMDDADLDKAVKAVIASKFRNAGQTCICTNRIYVQESVVQVFSEKMENAVSNLKVGDGLKEGVDVGPLINERAVEKVKEHIADAAAKGAQVICGGEGLEAGAGYYFQPTVVLGANETMLCMNEETFGPLAPIASFKDEEEVIQKANHTPYGLAAYVFTENIGRAIRICEKLEYGIVGLNDGLPSVAQAPFGGFKESGLGREGGHYGIDEFLEVKYISIAF